MERLPCDQNNLHKHLACQVLKGGGYKSMFKNALLYLQRNNWKNPKASILLVDGDRAERNDGWSLSQLKQEASKEKITVCVQTPNQEGLLLRLMPGNENLQPASSTVLKKLCTVWPDYQKPVDARTLTSKFSLNDLLRVARVDAELSELLSLIGVYR